MKLKVLEKIEGCLPEIIAKGDWIDLKAAEDIVLKAPYIRKLKKFKKDDTTERIREVTFDHALVSLGVCIEAPAGCECIIVPRSSTFKKMGIVQSNSAGIVDNSYKGNDDIWKMPVIALRNTVIPKGTRIAQFRVQLSQKATVWQKIKWLLSNSIKIKKVEYLNNTPRSGFGSTGD